MNTAQRAGFRIGLAQRIVIAFVLMTGAVALVFSVALMHAIELVEAHLITEGLNQTLDHWLRSETALHGPVTTGFPYLFDSRGQLGPLPPDWSNALAPGFNEVERDGDTLHAVVREIDGRRVLLFDDATDFERRETLIRWLIVLGALASTLLAGVLGAVLARRIMAPVVRLAERVRDVEALSYDVAPIAGDFADDEVGRLAEAFDHSLDALRRALARERLITSDISHELRNPLMVIASSCEVLAARSPDASPEGRTLARIVRASREMQEIVDTLLALARAEQAGEGAVRRISLRDAVEEQLARWQPLAGQRGLTLSMQDTDEVPHDEQCSEPGSALRLPAAPLATVLSNLIRNALHYTEAGSVCVSIGRSAVSVIDSGPGIPAHDRDRLFQPFMRGDGSQGDGIGIGLSLVERICASQGWRVTLEPNQPHGCIFRIAFDAV